jgi:carbamoyl-phosphate synthase large subunit
VSFVILITAVGGGLSSQAIRCLQDSSRHQISVVGVDVRPDAAGRHVADAFYTVPHGGDVGYVKAILDIVAREKVDLVLPWSDEEALAMAARREDIERGGCRLACAPLDMLRRLSDKDETFKLLKSHEIPVPAWRRAENTAELEEAVAAFESSGEFTLKPAQSRGNRDIYVIRPDMKTVTTTPSGRELHMDAATFRRDYFGQLLPRMPFLVMERLVPPAYDIDILSRAGEALRVVPRQRINAEGMPFHGNIVVNSAALIDLGRRVAAAASLSWLYDVDVMTSKDGQPVVIEVNPRPSGSLVASIAAGVPLLDDLVSFAKGEPLSPCEVPERETIVPYTAVAKVRKRD